MRRRVREGSREKKVGAAGWLLPVYRASLLSVPSYQLSGLRVVVSSELSVVPGALLIQSTASCVHVDPLLLAAAEVPAEFLQHWTTPSTEREQPRASHGKPRHRRAGSSPL